MVGLICPVVAHTRSVRLELADGHLDPWGKGKLFGIRQVLVIGKARDTLPCKAADVLKASAAEMPIGGPLAEAQKACAVRMIEGKIDDMRLNAAEVLSHACPVRSSEAGRAENITDGTDSEWWTPQETAWLEIDLGRPSCVWEVSVQWWGISVSDNFRILSSVDGSGFTERRTQADAGAVSEYCNGWTKVLGWDETTTCVRLELADGHLDPWDKGMLFGIRQVLIKGECGTHYIDGRNMSCNMSC